MGGAREDAGEVETAVLEQKEKKKKEKHESYGKLALYCEGTPLILNHDFPGKT